MVGTRDKRSPVLVKAGAVVAAGALTVGFLLVACSGTPGPETAPAPSDAPDLDNSVVAEAGNASSPSQTSIVTDDGASTGSSPDVDSGAAAEPPAEDPEAAEPESAEDPVDAEPEFLVESVEELAPTEPAGA